MLYPFMPETSEKINKQIKSNDKDEAFGKIEAGVKLETPEPIFMRIDETAKMKEIEEEIASKLAQEDKTEPMAPEIEFSDFEKLDLRVALVTECEEVKKSDKLLKFTLKVGNQTRTVVSGIKKHYKPEDLVGKKVIMVYNLKPVKLKGILSEGMILCAESGEDLCLIQPFTDIADGAKLY